MEEVPGIEVSRIIEIFCRIVELLSGQKGAAFEIVESGNRIDLCIPVEILRKKFIGITYPFFGLFPKARIEQNEKFLSYLLLVLVDLKKTPAPFVKRTDGMDNENMTFSIYY